MKTINSSGKIPLEDVKVGSDCSGIDGATDRTITTDHEIQGAIIIAVQGARLHRGAGLDYTQSGNTITFLNAVDDTDNISIVY